ncbi:PLC-like phosphodiesterase [Coniophora puteana RWD-64-598 SS2]|uniref:PLC-like phosphodiesterase n=1 Tax=Coniophora puteana (strain RWD-64-598) TaxID=741705 RepID=A0A5M3N4T1_CONPW|nr:PLC-like phosphodiesterase [Coniophora puteana RWD-64-598 SS2]EIW85921.1 PLC-like phosphodiesterase [Coniophora puteana RWD-64-598 SS2]
MGSASTPPLPECWGHRGASAAFPENTLASFEAAIRDGVEVVETDVHVSADGVLIMFHDPDLRRTTGSIGKIKERNWYGPDGMEHLRTLKQPAQSIPTFAETIALFMQPENRHVKLNVDVKIWADPERVFSLMHDTLASQLPDWETELAPRIILGLWHPKFLPYAKKYLPSCARLHIGASTSIARKYFWDEVDVFSINYGVLATVQGRAFRRDCLAAGKSFLVWTVNDPRHMLEATKWGAKAVLTDYPERWLRLREEMSRPGARDTMLANNGFLHMWTTPLLWVPAVPGIDVLVRYMIQKNAGSLDEVSALASAKDDAAAPVA